MTFSMPFSINSEFRERAATKEELCQRAVMASLIISIFFDAYLISFSGTRPNIIRVALTLKV